jgi:hypothetical protein
MAEELGSATESEKNARSRKDATYRVFVSSPGQESWSPTELFVTTTNREQAETKAARLLEENPDYRDLVQGEGVGMWLVVSYKPLIVRAEPQPSKVTKRKFG